MSRSHSGDVKTVAEKAFGQSSITPAGGAGFKTLEVASGAQDAYVHVTLIKKWDVCAGNAILAAAGGRMTTLKGSRLDYAIGPSVKNKDGLLATMKSEKDHEEFLQKLQKHLKS